MGETSEGRGGGAPTDKQRSSRFLTAHSRLASGSVRAPPAAVCGQVCLGRCVQGLPFGRCVRPAIDGGGWPSQIFFTVVLHTSHCQNRRAVWLVATRRAVQHSAESNMLKVEGVLPSNRQLGPASLEPSTNGGGLLQTATHVDAQWMGRMDPLAAIHASFVVARTAQVRVKNEITPLSVA